jgi:hypothetical protein
MRLTQIILALATVLLAQPTVAQGQGNGQNPTITIPVHSETGTIMGSATSIVYSVPSGQRLSIEFLTVTGTKMPSQDVVQISVRTTLDSAQLSHTISQKLADEFHTNNAFAESKAVQLFADENTNVIIRVVGNLGTNVAAGGGALFRGAWNPCRNRKCW